MYILLDYKTQPLNLTEEEESKKRERSRANKSSQQVANNAAPAVPVNLQTAHLDPEKERERERERPEIYGQTNRE